MSKVTLKAKISLSLDFALATSVGLFFWKFLVAVLRFGQLAGS